MRKELYTLLIIVTIITATAAFGQNHLTYEQQVFDFGNVAIDFNIFHTYYYINATDKPVRITDLEVSCDCSTVALPDSLIEPGDTAFFMLTFNTRDYYGPTNKSFVVTTDDPGNPELKYFYMSTVGQWFHGLRPNPISLFFLPPNKVKKITIPNKKFDEIRLTDYYVADSAITVSVTKESAAKGKQIEIEVAPNANLGRGNYLTSLTLKLDVEGAEKPTILSVPVKIARY